MQMSLRPLVQNEGQLLYVCHLVGPILNRLTNERPKMLLEVKFSFILLCIHYTVFTFLPPQLVMEIYHLLQNVDQHQGGHLKHSDLICDFLYPPPPHTHTRWLFTMEGGGS